MVGIEILSQFRGPLSLELLGDCRDSHGIDLDVDLGNVRVVLQAPLSSTDDGAESVSGIKVIRNGIRSRIARGERGICVSNRTTLLQYNKNLRTITEVRTRHATDVTTTESRGSAKSTISQLNGDEVFGVPLIGVN